MTQNDFLYFLFSLPPLVVAIITWIWGFGSLVFYGLKTKAVRSVVLKSPGMMIGDFFILPTITFLITYFYQTIKNPLPLTTSFWWTMIMGLVSLFFAAILAVKFNPKNLWFLPHSLFIWFMTYLLFTFLSKGFYQLIFGENTLKLWLIWVLVLVGILIHEFLGIIKSKNFPH